MPDPDPTLNKLREFCLSLPDVTEEVAWGHPVFKAGGKMFCGYEELDGKWTIGFKLEVPHAELLASHPRVLRAQSFGRHKWVSLATGAIGQWDGVRDLIMESFLLSAPRRTIAKLHPRQTTN